jgi:hypothetical protein
MNQNSEQNNNRDRKKNKNQDSRWTQYGLSGFNGFLDQVTKRIEINIETFLVGSISLLIFALALLFDKLALFILGLLIAPILSPILALAFGINLGAFKFIKIGILSFLLNSISFFIVSGFSGFIARQFPEREFITWKLFVNFGWAEIILLIVGIMIMISTILKNPRQSSLIANVALAYCFYLPLIAAGFAFGLGLKDDFLTAGSTFLLYFGMATILGVVVLFLYKIRPVGFKNALVFIGFLAIILVGTIIYFQANQSQPILEFASNENQVALDTIEPTKITNTITLNSAHQSSTTSLPSSTSTESNSSVFDDEIEETLAVEPTSTATITLTPLPEIIWAEIQSPEGNGANIREGPGFSSSIVKTVLNGTAVQVLDDVEVVDGVTWIHIRFIDGVDGWIVRNLIVSATPEPEW